MKKKDKKNLGNEIINYGILHPLMLRIEEIIIKEEELDYVEQKLLYDVLLDRRMDRINKVKMNDSISNMPFGSIIKRVMKGDKKDE